ncbi:MAG: hypothetical protein Q9227_004234 [Pyrenula ochraceoflavens]
MTSDPTSETVANMFVISIAPLLNDNDLIESEIVALNEKLDKHEKEHKEFKSILEGPKMRNRFFDGVKHSEVWFVNVKDENTLASPSNVLFPVEILQEIIKLCEPSTRVVLALTSKQLAANVYQVDKRLDKKNGITAKRTELQIIHFLHTLKSWIAIAMPGEGA